MVREGETQHVLITSKREIWVKHYCSSHQILLVGEGDFSFSLSLAQSFGSASNIVASSLNSYDVLIKMYKQAKSNLEKLKSFGASILHGVDATKMELHSDLKMREESDLKMRKFDRIIFNFPHAGFHGKEDDIHVIKKHRTLVHGFFGNASGMLTADGEIHVNHKTTFPFNRWNLKELASQNSLALFECVDFKNEDYPGYSNKRGARPRCDEPFPLGECSTYKFRFSPNTKKTKKVLRDSDMVQARFQHPQRHPVQTLQQPFVPCECRQPQPNYTTHTNGIPWYVNGISGHIESPLPNSISYDSSRIFQEYFTHARETFGRTDCYLRCSVHNALKLGHARYMAEVPGGDWNGYINLLEELRRLSISRLAWLQNMLVPDHRW